MARSQTGAVQVVGNVSAEAISALANKELIAVRIPEFCDREVCSHVMQGLVENKGEGYRVEPDFRKFIGGALFDGAGDPDVLQAYFEKTPAWFNEGRKLFGKFISPAEKMRLHLEEIWPNGARLERVAGRPAFAGLIRGFKAGAEARPHQDMTNWDLPDSPEAQSLKTQLSCLTYFACADEGGELELWDREIADLKTYEATKTNGDYGLNRKLIGDPDAVLSPLVGELIVFNARRIHAVRQIRAGVRYSQSFFIGVRPFGEPLSIFS